MVWELQGLIMRHGTEHRAAYGTITSVFLGALMDHETKSGQNGVPPEGRYANYFKVGHNTFELLMDFGQCYGENEEPQLHTRIITSPAYGKALLKTLGESLDAYEKAYGRVGE